MEKESIKSYFSRLTKVYEQVSNELPKMDDYNHCETCRHCCAGPMRPKVQDIEYDYLRTLHSESEVEAFRDYVALRRDEAGNLLYDHCPFYSFETGCMIHPHRPFSCRTFGPYMYAEDLAEAPELCVYKSAATAVDLLDYWTKVPLAREFAKLKRDYLEFCGGDLMDDFAKEVLRWEAAVEQAPQSAKTHERLAAAYHNAGRIGEAKDVYRKAIKLNPQSPFSHFHLAVILDDEDQWDFAKKEYLEALALRPKDSHIHSRLAFGYSKRGYLQEAISEHKIHAELEPDNPEPCVCLGFIYGQLGWHEESIPHFEKAVNLQPGDTDCLYALSLAYCSSGWWEKAEHALKQVLTVNPTYVPALTILGRVYGKRNALDEARKILTKARTLALEQEKTSLIAEIDRDLEALAAK
ncbi:MAG: tetratricopeptide repeat protein [Armatimonadetes bacterium]|nr:tetratricopeptide repeat protein [Armatimonadota bacterium]